MQVLQKQRMLLVKKLKGVTNFQKEEKSTSTKPEKVKQKTSRQKEEKSTSGSTSDKKEETEEKKKNQQMVLQNHLTILLHKNKNEKISSH